MEGKQKERNLAARCENPTTTPAAHCATSAQSGRFKKVATLARRWLDRGRDHMVRAHAQRIMPQSNNGSPTTPWSLLASLADSPILPWGIDSPILPWRIFYVSTLENILRFKRREYFTYLRGRIFYVSEVENILRMAGRVYFTVTRWRIKYGVEVEYILRIPGRIYSTYPR